MFLRTRTKSRAITLQAAWVSKGTYHLSLLGILFDISHERFLLAFELDTLAIKFTSCTLNGAQVRAQTLCGRLRASKQSL